MTETGPRSRLKRKGTGAAMASNRQKSSRSRSATPADAKQGVAASIEPGATSRASAAAKRTAAKTKSAPAPAGSEKPEETKPRWARPLSSSPLNDAVAAAKPAKPRPPTVAKTSAPPRAKKSGLPAAGRRAVSAAPESAPPPAAPRAAVEPAPAKDQAPAQAAPREPTPAPPALARPAQERAPAKPEARALGEAIFPVPDAKALARNIALAIEHGSKAFTAYMRPRATGEIKTTIADEIGEMVKSLSHVAEYYMTDPRRAFEAQTALTTQFIDLWAETLKRFQGGADELNPREREKAQFYLRQVTAALSPTNFIGTNPELIRATLAESGENLVRGLKMLAEDIEAGKGNLRIRQVDARAFKLGVNLAATPGKVVFRNEIIELIQYEPTTAQVYKRPLLIIPPWINKFYILDLNPEKSFVRWAVGQGLTVFVVSWVNPDERLAAKGFEDYMREGVLAALDAVEKATGERDIAAIGYCVGCTLLSATLCYMTATGYTRVKGVTFFTTLADFTDAGDLKIFVDAEQLKAIEERMAEQGYLEGSAMANAFNMLRPNDLIWSYYVNNYLKGKDPMPFDLLVWNSDSTRMPAANHKFYLRHCYLQNDLSNGRMVLDGQRIDLKKVTIPIYELSAREDHIAPARGVFKSAQFFGGPVRFVMAGSGHIAGVINPPNKVKCQYWTDGPPEGEFDDWVKKAEETPGSWWPDWIAWITAQAPEKVPPRTPGEGALKAIGEAPGEYVRVKA